MARDRRYYEVDDEGAGERLAKHGTGARNFLVVPRDLRMWKPKKTGSLTIDIVPFMCTESHTKFHEKVRFKAPGKWHYERTLFVHYGVGPGNESFTCPWMTFGKPCPICQQRAQYNQSPHKDDQKKAASLKPKERQLFLVYDHDAPDEGLQLWEVAYHNFGEYLDTYIRGADPEDLDAYRKFYRMVGGYTLRLTATEESAGDQARPYSEYSVHQFKPRKEDLPQEIMEHRYNLDDMVKVLDYDSLRKIFYGEVEPDDEEGGQTRAKSTDGDELNGDGRDDHSRTTVRDGEKDKKLPFATGDKVLFEERGEEVIGRVAKVKVDEEVIYVEVRGRDKPAIVDFSEARLVKADDTWDRKEEAENTDKEKQAPPKEKKEGKEPTKPATKGRRGEWDDEDDDRSFQPRGKEKTVPPDEDDDPPPRRGRK